MAESYDHLRGLLDQVFPFHFAVGRDLDFVAVGPRLAALVPAAALGEPLAAAFEPFRPSEKPTWESLTRTSRAACQLRHPRTGLTLRGQFLPLAGTLLFVGVPEIEALDELPGVGLSLADFPAHDGRMELLEAVARQTTARQEAEQRAAEAEEAAHRERARADALEQALQEIQDTEVSLRRIQSETLAARRAAELKDQFIATMSHELRTPLNAVLGFSRLALETPLDLRQRGYLEKVVGAGRTLLTLVNDVLDFSKIEAGSLTLEEHDFVVEEVVRAVCESFVARAEARGVAVVIDWPADLPRSARGDSLRLGQILTHLVSNAVKFTSEGEVRIGLQAAPSAAGRGHEWTFSVRDTGIGMEGTARKLLFAPFSQADQSTTRKFGGAGLGLSLAHRLVLLMGGSIDVESQPGLGSRFSFHVPLQVTSVSMMPEPVLPASIAGMRALVSTRHPGEQALICRTLEGWSIEAEAATSADDLVSAALQAELSGRPFGLVFLETGDPAGEGLTRLRTLGAPGALRVPPMVLAVVGHGETDKGHAEARAAGAHGTLHRPIMPSPLRRTLAQHAATATMPEQAATRPSLEGMRVLLVEDNEINQLLMCELLEDAGVDVGVAGHGEEALSLLAAAPPGQRFDLVLMDIEMPVMDGLTATREIRSRPEFAHLPVVALTAHAIDSHRRASGDAGMSGYLTKPVEPSLLWPVLEKYHPSHRPPSAMPSLMPPATSSDERMETLRTGADRTSGDPGTTGLPQAPEGVDLADLLGRLGGDLDMARHMLRLFTSRRASQMQLLEAAALARDPGQIRAQAHALRGTAANLGLRALAEDAKTLELAASADTDPRVLALSAQSLAEALGTLGNAILDWLQPPAPEPASEAGDATARERETRPPPPPSKESTRRRVVDLRARLRRADFESFDLVRQRRGELETALGREGIEALDRALESFDYEQALAVLDRIPTED